MRAALWTALLLGGVGAVAVVAAADGAQLICSRSECTCQERDGLELVTCDCSGPGDGDAQVGTTGTQRPGGRNIHFWVGTA